MPARASACYDLTDDTVNRIDGTRATRAAAGALSHFAADITDAARAAYNALFPNRLALKQVHSQQNPEKDWGTDTLVAAQLRVLRAQRPLRRAARTRCRSADQHPRHRRLGLERRRRRAARGGAGQRPGSSTASSPASR